MIIETTSEMNATFKDEKGKEIKRITGCNIEMKAGEAHKATIEVLFPILKLENIEESYSFFDLEDYPTKYLEELKEKINEELESRCSR
jgi:hypothetical protein